MSDHASLKRILVTGGAGFVGSNLVTILLDAGLEVAVVDNLSFGKKKFLPLQHPQFTFLSVDIRDDVKLTSFFQEFHPDAVVHLAAIHFIPYCNQHPAETADINIMGTRRVFQACETVSPKIVFFASSAAVYPNTDEPNTELTDTGPTDIYGITKLTGEYLAELFHHRSGIRTVIGRFFNVYGPNETNPHVIPEIITQLRNGQRELSLGAIRPRRDFIHVTDLGRAINLLLQSETAPFDVCNIGTGKEYSVKDIVTFCENILGEPITIVSDPTRFRKVERMHLFADNSKLRRLTGWQPEITLKDGLRDLLEASLD